MDNDTKPEVQEQNPATPAKRRVRKPAAAKPLVLGVPTAIDGSKDTTLVQSVNSKYQAIRFYEADAKPGAKPAIVVHDTEHPNLAKFPGAAMQGFIYALVNTALGGAGLSPDGSALYVDANAKQVMAYAPKFSTYIIELVPSGRAGVTSYRSTVGDFITLASIKARILRTSLKTGRTMGRKTRAAGAKAPKPAEVSF